ATSPWPCGTSICVLSVVEPTFVWNAPRMDDEPDRTAEGLVKLAVKRFQNGCTQTYGLVKHGDPKTVILDEAARTGANLVVVGSAGHSGVTRFLLGSVAQSVVRFARCSVRVVRARASEDGVAYSGARILLATDGSEYSQAAAREVAGRSWLPGSEV